VRDVSPFHSSLSVGKASRIQAQRSDSYSRYTLLFVYANLLSSLYTEMHGDGFIALVGNYNLWSTDIASLTGVPMVLSAIYNRSNHFNVPRIILLCWLGLMAFSLTRGILISPFEALFSFRPHAAFCVALFAFSLRPVDPAMFWKICRAFIWTGVGIAMLAFARRYISPGLFAAANQDFLLTDRPIFSPSALILGEAVIFVMSQRQLAAKLRSSGIGSRTILTFVLIAGLLVTGQRTAAIATVMGAAIIAIDITRLRFGGLVNPVTFFGGLIVFVVAGTVGAGQLLSLLPKTFTAGDAVGDLQLRYAIWASIMENFSSWPIFMQLFGKADPWTLFWYLGVGNSVDTRSAHNELFGAVLNVGILGVFLIVGAVATCVAGAVGAQFRNWSRNASGLSPALVLALLVTLIIYGVSYEWLFEQGIVLGLCAAGWPRRKFAGRRLKSGAIGKKMNFQGAS